MFDIFKPKQIHPKWYLWLYPQLWMVRHAPKIFFFTIIGQHDWHWHGYEWEKIEYVDIELDKAHRQSVTEEGDIIK
jgi:hypothetical protein